MSEKLPAADVAKVIASLTQANANINPALLSFSAPPSVTNKSVVVSTKSDIEAFFPPTDETSFSSSTSSESLMTAYRKEVKGTTVEAIPSNSSESKTENEKKNENEKNNENVVVVTTPVKAEIPVSVPIPLPLVPAWGGWGSNGTNSVKSTPGKKPDDFLRGNPLRHITENNSTSDNVTDVDLNGGVKSVETALQELRDGSDSDDGQENVPEESEEIKECPLSPTQEKKKSFLDIQVSFFSFFLKIHEYLFDFIYISISISIITHVLVHAHQSTKFYSIEYLADV